jgi:hypothetical protein
VRKKTREGQARTAGLKYFFIGVWMTYALAFLVRHGGGDKVENWLFNDFNPNADYPLGESPPKRNSGSPMKNSNEEKDNWISDLTPYFLRSRPSENQGGFGAKPGFFGLSGRGASGERSFGN